MPNIASALRDEIKRLSRQQSRTQMDPTKKATAVHRRDIALLKRQVVALERQVKSLMRRPPSTSSAPQASAPELKVRFVAKGLRSQRDRLGAIRGKSREGAGRQRAVRLQLGQRARPRSQIDCVSPDRRCVLPRRDYEGRARRDSVRRCLLLILRGANSPVMFMRLLSMDEKMPRRWEATGHGGIARGTTGEW